MILNFLIEVVIKFTIPIYCLIFGIDYYYLFNKNKKLKHLVIAITLFGLFIFIVRL